VSGSPQRRRRPWELTIVVVLAYIQGVLDVALGIVLLLTRYLDDVRAEGDAFFVTVVGAAVILFGLLVIAVASGIARGDRVARIVLTVGVSLSLALDAASIVIDPSQPWGSVVSAAIGVAILVISWTGRGARHFRRAPAPTV
jgi:hypothetical protein